jgi:hypothetical protein
MKTCLILATWLVLTGCSQEGSKSAVSRKSEGEKNEVVNRGEAVRWAFANKREIESAIFQWSRDKLEESRKSEALSPETRKRFVAMSHYWLN